VEALPGLEIGRPTLGPAEAVRAGTGAVGVGAAEVVEAGAALAASTRADLPLGGAAFRGGADIPVYQVVK
jgi:hypothetical protein